MGLAGGFVTCRTTLEAAALMLPRTSDAQDLQPRFLVQLLDVTTCCTTIRWTTILVEAILSASRKFAGI